MCIAAKKARKSGKPLKRQVSSPSFQRKEKSGEKVSATNSLVLDFYFFPQAKALLCGKTFSLENSGLV